MADESAPTSKNVLGRSRIFTPEVINDIHVKAELGRYRMRGFSIFKPMPHWDELVFLPGTLTRFVIEGYREKCVTKTVLGARFAKKPLELDIPIYITGMSFGALSLEAKMALAKGASMAGTATCSGEGGMIPPERDYSTKWYYQVIQSRYGFNPHHLMLADAIEFFIGQGCKVGLGGHLMGQKVTEQVAEMRSLPAGIDQRSPARHPDWLGPDDLSLKIQEIREATDYQVPIQLKLGAARVYDDVRMAAKCGPDIIYLDGGEGGTGAGPHIATEETGIPLMAAIPEARRALEDVGLADEVDLVVAGGIRNGADVAKCLALGAKAVALGHASLMALNCNKEIPGVTDYEGTIGVPAGQCYHCHTGRCPVGITTQDPELRKRLVVEEASERVYNFLTTLTMELQMLARACGKTNVHSLEPEDLAALTIEASAMARVPLAGTNYTVGQTEQEILAEVKRLLAIKAEEELEVPGEVTDLRAVESRMSRPRARVLRAREDQVDRRGVPLRAALPVPGGHLARRGRRPRGGDSGRGPELARGHRAPARRTARRRSSTGTATRSSRSISTSPKAARTSSPARCSSRTCQSGNSYGIQLKEQHTKFPQPELGPWVAGSKTVGADWKRPCSRAGSAPPGTEHRTPLQVMTTTKTAMARTMERQPADLRRLVTDREGIAAGAERLAGRRVFVVGTGTSWHAANLGVYFLRLAGVDALAVSAADCAEWGPRPTAAEARAPEPPRHEALHPRGARTRTCRRRSHGRDRRRRRAGRRHRDRPPGDVRHVHREPSGCALSSRATCPGAGRSAR